MTALDTALRYLQTAADPAPREVCICSDSQSALRRLKYGPAAQTDVLADKVWRRLNDLADRGVRLHLQWVPGHAGLPGNELADEVARAAADLDQAEAPVDLSWLSPDLGDTLIGSGRRDSAPLATITRTARVEWPRASGPASPAVRAWRWQGSGRATRLSWRPTGTESGNRRTQPARNAERRRRLSGIS